ncbi:hypothetical protein A1O1_00497 [Capronia coronata CBS 617.96]|uniref:Uncharacterized protein n=1 Tax=Capronia coronata CBS 617.96 TaxID=1182541 RepID=W9Z1E8_9EURO|nr:uncharacterized protein A1O1_00497 [Capronia coronata CBS 617.96]EXJ95376.1 hypothetical protein A1O1_00497 [Capronia coronata CBS 617.96]
MSLWGYRTMYYRTEGPGGRRHFGGFGTHFRLVLMGMITAYGVWFWIEGVEDGLSDCDRRRNCGGLQSFFVVPVKVDSWANRSIQLVVSVGAATYYGIMNLAALAGGTAYIVRRIAGKAVHWELIKEQDSSVNLTKRELTKWYIGLSCFNLAWIVYAIVSIEFTLNLNHMNNVIGTSGLVGPGQLIPLAIGLLSLTRVLYILSRQHIPWLRKKNRGSNDDDDSQVGHFSPTSDRNYIAGIGLTMTNTQTIYSPHSSSPGQTPSVDRGSISTLPPLPAIAAPSQRRSLPHRILLAWLPWLGLFEWSKHSLTPSLGHYSSFGGLSLNGLYVRGGKATKTKDAEAGFEVTRRTEPAFELTKTRTVDSGMNPQAMKPLRYSKSRYVRIRSPPGQQHDHDHDQSQPSSTTTTTSPVEVSINTKRERERENEQPSIITAGLLSSPPQLAPGQKGLMSPDTGDNKMDIQVDLQGQRRSESSEVGITGHARGIYDGEGYDHDDYEDYDISWRSHE